MPPPVMPAKPQINRQLGQQEAFLPQCVPDALAANERLKFALAALQAAEHSPARPESVLPATRRRKSASYLRYPRRRSARRVCRSSWRVLSKPAKVSSANDADLR